MAKSVPGRRALVQITGNAVAFAGEACTDTGDHQTYQITNVVKRVWDRTAAVTVKVAGVVTGESHTINRLKGTVTFAVVNAGRGAVTVDGSYLPVSTVALAHKFSWQLMANHVDNTDFDTAGTNGGWITKSERTQLDASGTLSHWQNMASTYFRDALLAGTIIVIEFWPDRTLVTPDLKVWALLNKRQLQSAVDGLSDVDVEFQAVPDADGNVAATFN